MATKKAKEKNEKDGMEMKSVLNVKDRVKTLEEAHPDPTNKKPHRDKCYCFKKALASRFSGLFLGPLFGLFLYWYITYLILSGPPFTREIIMNANLTESGTVATDGGTSSQPTVLFDDSVGHIIGGSVGGTAGVLLVVGSLTSRRTRCAMLLMIPSLVSKRGRALMISVTTGFLLSGPLQTIDLNIQEMVHSITCLYGKIKEVCQQYIDEFQRLWNDLEQIFKQITDLINQLTKINIIISVLTLNPLWFLWNVLVPDIDFNLDKVFSQLKTSNISDIHLRLNQILKVVFDTVRTYGKYASKLHYLSIILTIWDAYYYMHRYFSDDAFDNMCADDSLRDLWWSGNKEKILPLRRWEQQRKYRYSTAIKLSKKEYKRFLKQVISTIVFSIIAASILGFDAVLTGGLQVFHDNAKLVILHDGMEIGVDFTLPQKTIQKKFKLRGFNLTTEQCLPNPKTTDYGLTCFIVTIIILCLLSCLLEAFGSRLRARICNLVFEDRALQRAEYLYKHIKAGRVARRFQFNMLICQQLDILDRKAQFCFCCPCFNRDSSIYKACSRVTVSETCPGCQKSFKKDDGKVYKVTHNGEQKDVLICSECNEDVK